VELPEDRVVHLGAGHLDALDRPRRRHAGDFPCGAGMKARQLTHGRSQASFTFTRRNPTLAQGACCRSTKTAFAAGALRAW